MKITVAAIIIFLFMLINVCPAAYAKPEITHQFVERLFQECTQHHDTYGILSGYGFSYDDWRLIAQYTEDNIKSPSGIVPAGSIYMDTARYNFLDLTKDILGELAHDKVVDASLLNVEDYSSKVDCHLYVVFLDGRRGEIYVTYRDTLFDPRITPLMDLAKGTWLKFYLSNQANAPAVKIMLSAQNQEPLPVSDISSEDILLYYPALTENQLGKLREQMQ